MLTFQFYYIEGVRLSTLFVFIFRDLFFTKIMTTFFKTNYYVSDLNQRTMYNRIELIYQSKEERKYFGWKIIKLFHDSAENW